MQWITLPRPYCTNTCIGIASQLEESPTWEDLRLIQDWNDPPVDGADPTSGYGPYNRMRINQLHARPGRQQMAEVAPTITTTRKIMCGLPWRSISSGSVQSTPLASMIRFRFQRLQMNHYHKLRTQSRVPSNKEA